MLDFQQGYFSDFAGQQREDQRENYGGGLHRYSQAKLHPQPAQVAPPFLGAGELAGGAAVHQCPWSHAKFRLLSAILTTRSLKCRNLRTLPWCSDTVQRRLRSRAAYWVLDQKGKEVVSITWEKLASRAEKVGQVIRDKSSLYRGDRVALIYTENEIIEFAVALMGCFLAGVVAVPINDLRTMQD